MLESSSFETATLKLAGPKSGTITVPAAEIYVIDAQSVAGTLVEVIGHIFKAHPQAQVLVLAESLTEQFAFPLLNMGVKGLVTLDLMTEQLPRALEALGSGGFWVPRSLLATFVDSVISRSRQVETQKPMGAEISRREQDIMDGLLQNLSNKEIASRLNISERTVKFHVSNLLTKFNVQRRADLILLWYQQKVQPGNRSAGFAASRRLQ